MDWSATPLGEPGNWPDVLKQTVSIMLKNNFPLLICWGPDFTQLYNDTFRPINGETKHPQALGGSALDTYAEIWEIIGPMFREVMQGQTHGFPDFMVTLNRNGYPKNCYFDFSYSPIADLDGVIRGVLVICMETTEKVRALEQAKKAQSETMMERDRLRHFFLQAPAGICVLDGHELTFEFINPLYQQLFPGRELLGKPLLDAVPEVKGAPIWDILQGVYQTGITYEGHALLIPLARTSDGPVEDRYFNFIYQARKNLHGKVDGIVVCVFEVSDMVATQKELRDAQDMLELAITASAIGIWRADLSTDELVVSPRTRAIHAIPDGKEMTLALSLEMIANEDRDRVVKNIAKAVETKAIFSDEYWIHPMDGSKPRWLRSNGKAFYDEKGDPLYIAGAIFDLTEQKEDDNRKNDFIGMVSHELKTPLTSLNAYLQMLKSKAKTAQDDFTANALEQSVKQVKKMTAMINGFLNVSRLESGKIVIDKELFNMADLVKESEAETILMNATHTFIFHPVERTLVHADLDKIGQVISNLISNAVKYSKGGSTIQIACITVNGHAQVSVSDEGMGIDPQHLGDIFNRYYRVENKNNISGFGIGLYLSAEIVQRHEGKIWVESKLGKGSAFYFSLPL